MSTSKAMWARGGALMAGGLVAGAVLAGTLTANAATTPTPSSTSGTTATTQQQAPRDESRSQRPDEHLLTGDTAGKVRAAALAKYPGATILRVETDSDGVYEAHLTTAAGDRVTVEVGKDYSVTGTERGGPGGPGGGHRGPGGPPPAAAPTTTG